MKRYPKYKDSWIEWIGEVPEHWEVKKLKYFSKIVNGSTPQSGNGEYWGGEIVWVTPNDLGKLNGNRITDSLKKITQRGLNSCGTTLTPKNSIILSTRAPIGHIGITDIVTCTNQGCKTIVHDSSKCDNKFLFYYLFSSKNTLQSLGQGSTFIELSSQNLKDFQNPVPLFHEQQAIATYLDRKTHQIDTFIEKKQKLIALLKEQRAAIINHAVTKGLNPNVKLKDSGIEWLGVIPEHWDVKKLKYFGEIVLGKMLTPQDKGNYYKKPYLRAQNILWEKVDPSDIKEMWFSEKELSQYRLKENDLLVSEGGEVGRTAIWKNELEECYIQNSVHKVTINESHNPFYFLYFFLIYGQAGHFDAIVNRVSIAHLTREKLKEVPFAIPPPTEQQSITDYLYKKTTIMDESIKKQERQIKLLKEYRTALISEVVTGKIDVRDYGEQEVISS